MNKKLIKFIIKLIVSAGLLAWIIIQTNWEEVFTALSEADLWKIIVYVLVLLLGMVISSYKWKVLVNFKNIHHPFKDFFRFYLAGTLVNSFMPSFIGGDTFRAYQIGKTDKKYVEAASTVMIDRITGFVGFTILVLVFGLLNIKTVLGNKVLIIANVLVLLSLSFDIVVAKIKKLSSWKRIYKYLPEKVPALIEEIDRYNNSRILPRAIILSVLFAFAGVALSNYVLFWALGIHIGLLNYLSVIFIISIISSLPISINNIGIKEWAYITFFGIFGVNTSLVIAAALLSRLIQMLISLLALPTYLRSRG